MLLESLVKATVELQGFRVARVTGDVAGLVAELVPDGRYAPRCGRCDERGHYRDTWRVRRFLGGSSSTAASTVAISARSVSRFMRSTQRMTSTRYAFQPGVDAEARRAISTQAAVKAKGDL